MAVTLISKAAAVQHRRQETFHPALAVAAQDLPAGGSKMIKIVAKVNAKVGAGGRIAP